MSEMPKTHDVDVEAQNIQVGEQSFQELLDESMKPISTGAIVKGTVVQVKPNEVTVNLGHKSDAIISRNEFTDDPNADLTTLAKPGDVIEVQVTRVNDVEGIVTASKRKVDSQLNYKQLEAALADGTPLPGKVVEIVKGGIIANILGLRAFVPSSQVSNRFVQNLEEFKGKELDFNILELDRSKRRIVAGRRELAASESTKKRDEVFGKLQVGAHVEGTISRIVDFGAFVDLGGVDGLIHVSELSWKRVRKPQDVVSIGDKVNAVVIAIDPEKNKISLSLRDASTNPWTGILDKYPIGSIVEGTVVRLAPFGAFVSLEDGVDGLVHISQIANKRIEKPEDELSPGQVISVKVVDIDTENHKVSLSKREADAILNPPAEEDEEDSVVYDSASGIDKVSETLVEEETPVVEETVVVEEAPVAEEAAEPTEAESVTEKIEDAAHDVVEKVEEIAHDVTEKVKEVVEEIKEKIEDATE